ncbi:MAG: hypothetical protein K2J88_04260 [Oscillospiraceae bacterium]|nr:hypothetical protein [Oscillospiraceae bacterium]
MKKLFSCFIAICSLTGFISTMSVSAEDFTEQEFYVVSRNVPVDFDDYYLHCYSETIGSVSLYLPTYQTEHIFVNPENAKAITGDKISNYEYGDILIINSQEKYCSDDSYPPRYYIPSDDTGEIQYIGNCKELMKSKELTLTKKEKNFHNLPTLDSIIFFFEDKDGNEYQYYEYYYKILPELDMNLCAIGDTVTFTIYQDNLILPLELHQNNSIVPTGDVTEDNIVDIRDVIMITRTVLGKQTLTEVESKICDFDKNSIITPSDALQTMEAAIGLV